MNWNGEKLKNVAGGKDVCYTNGCALRDHDIR